MSALNRDSNEIYSVLLVEDDQFKQEQVEQVIRAARRSVHFTISRSVQQAVECVRARAYDLIVLDISLPSHESRPGGAQPISQPSGGVEVLLELAYEERVDPVVILTQYPEIEYDGRLYILEKFKKAISSSISVNILSVLLFNPKDKSWSDQLVGVL